MGGNNHSKLCAGDFERDLQRAEQEALKHLCILTPDTGDDACHIYCSPDEVDLFVEEVRTGPVVFHFKTGNSPAINPENFLEGGEKSGAGEMAAAAAVPGEVKLTGCAGDVMEKSEPGREFVMRVEPLGDISAETDPSEVLTLADVCNKVAHVLHVAEESSRDSSDETKGLSAVMVLPPSSLESQSSIPSTGSQTGSPPIGAAESLDAGDVHHPNEDTFLANEKAAPRGGCLELATEDTSGAPELEDMSSEETLKVAGDTTSDLSTTETAEECSDTESDLETLAEIWLNFGTVSEPLSILNGRKEKVPEDSFDGGKVDARLAMRPQRAQNGALATVDAEDATRQPIASEIFPTDKSHKRSIHALCKTRDAIDILLVCDAEDLPPLQKDGVFPMSEATKQNAHQMSVGQTMEAQAPTDVAEMNGAASSPRAPLETAEMEPREPLFSSTEPIVQVSKMEDNRPGSQLSPVFSGISDFALVDGSPGQRC